MNKLIAVALLCLPLSLPAADHGGAPAESAPAESAKDDTKHEHGGTPAESKPADAASSEHGGKPAPENH